MNCKKCYHYIDYIFLSKTGLPLGIKKRCSIALYMPSAYRYSEAVELGQKPLPSCRDFTNVSDALESAEFIYKGLHG